MKRIVAIIMLALVCVGLCACSNDGAPEGMQLASTEKDAKIFKLYVPKSWVLNTDSGISSAYFTKNPEDKSNVQVTIHLKGDGVKDVDGYWTRAKEEYKTVVTAFAVVSEGEKTVFGGKTAKKYVFTGKIGDNEYKYMQVIVQANDSFYVFTYTALTDNYDKHIEDVENIIEKFEFVGVK